MHVKTKSKIFVKVFAVVFFALCFVQGAPAEDKPKIIENKPTTLTYPSFWHTPFGIHRGTPFWLKVFLGNRTYFNGPQDLAATKLLVDYGKIRKGKDDWQLTVYGVNSGNSEVIYNPSMYSLGIFGKRGSGEKELNRPVGIACNGHGDIYIADTGNHRLSRWFNDGKEVKFITNLGKFGTGPGEFRSPKYLALDAAGRVYVSDTGNHRVQVFSKSGGFLYEIGKSEGVLNPQGITVCDSREKYSGYREDYIYLIDGNFNRLKKMDFSGSLFRTVRVDRAVGKKVFLTTLEQDYYGNVYVVDNKNSQIHKFSPDLFYIVSYGGPGTEDYRFDSPTGIAIYKHFGQVLVSDRESAQYFWIGADVKDFSAKQPGRNKLRFDFFVTELAYVTIQIETPKQTLDVCRKLRLDTGENTITWDIPEGYIGAYLMPGNSYEAIITISSTYSSHPHIKKRKKTYLNLDYREVHIRKN